VRRHPFGRVRRRSRRMPGGGAVRRRAVRGGRPRGDRQPCAGGAHPRGGERRCRPLRDRAHGRRHAERALAAASRRARALARGAPIHAKLRDADARRLLDLHVELCALAREPCGGAGPRPRGPSGQAGRRCVGLRSTLDESLRSRIDRGAIPRRAALRFGLDLARGLSWPSSPRTGAFSWCSPTPRAR
jgi:hypothetical protein